MPLLNGKTVIVTGASFGIGRAVALNLARTGTHVVGPAFVNELSNAFGLPSDFKTRVVFPHSMPEVLNGRGRALLCLPGRHCERSPLCCYTAL